MRDKKKKNNWTVKGLQIGAEKLCAEKVAGPIWSPLTVQLFLFFLSWKVRKRLFHLKFLYIFIGFG